MTFIRVLTGLIIMVTELAAQQAPNAQDWLTRAINQYFDDENQMHFKEITTKKYAEYKQDAINIHYDVPNSLSEEQFEQKWGDIYDLSYAGIGESFLLGQQDYGTVLMTKCHLTSQMGNKKFIFDTVISDTSFEQTYSIEITVVQTDSGYKIDDVKKKK